jgi:hypothetical protein
MVLLADAMPVFFIWLLRAIAGLFYIAPTILALKRGVRSGGYLFLLNLVLGWTVIGWVVALVWACTPVKRIPLPQQIDNERSKKPHTPDLDWLKDRDQPLSGNSGLD